MYRRNLDMNEAVWLEEMKAIWLEDGNAIVEDYYRDIILNKVN